MTVINLTRKYLSATIRINCQRKGAPFGAFIGMFGFFKKNAAAISVFVQFEDGSPSDAPERLGTSNPVDSIFHVVKLRADEIDRYGEDFDKTLESTARRSGWSARELEVYKSNGWAYGTRTLIDLAVLSDFSIQTDDEFKIATFAACSALRNRFRRLEDGDAIFLIIYVDGTVTSSMSSNDKAVGFYGFEEKKLGNYREIFD